MFHEQYYKLSNQSISFQPKIES